MYLYSDNCVKEIDNKASCEYFLSPLQLQESAAFLCYNKLVQYVNKESSGVVVVGKGNNGADGLAIARLLHLSGYNIEIYYLSDGDGTVEYNAQKRIACKLQIPKAKTIDNHVYIIDALIGVGLKGNARDDVKNLIECINSSNALIFSIDVPTGIGFDSNCLNSVNANITFSLGVLKASLYLNGNRARCGEIELLNPLFPKMDEIASVATLVNLDQLKLKKFKINSYKKTRGQLIIVGSSKAYPSTVLLSSKAAFSSGIGLVTIYTEDDVIPKIVNENPSIICRSFSDYKENDEATMLLGPGLGDKNDDNLLPFLKLKNTKVVDADGLRAYARLYKKGKIGKVENAIFTPHLGELKSLFEAFLPNFDNSTPFKYIENLKKLSTLINCVLVVKSEVAIIVKGDECAIVDLVNPSLAMAGSGDVLAAIIATLSAIDEDAAINGVLLHKKAGEYCALKYGYYSALDLIKAVGKVR